MKEARKYEAVARGKLTVEKKSSTGTRLPLAELWKYALKLTLTSPEFPNAVSAQTASPGAVRCVLEATAAKAPPPSVIEAGPGNPRFRSCQMGISSRRWSM
jgi:hypothetical protein